MITKTDLDHHIRRERYHREAALKSDDPGARKSHNEMAESHARRIRIAEAALARPKVAGEESSGDEVSGPARHLS